MKYKSKDKFVSVCLITYKHEPTIRNAIESILMQKVVFSWELIIADDNSQDNTRSIILEYYEKYPDLIKLLFQKINVGPSRNFVDLISMAKGKYIAYLEGDDFWTDPFKLQNQIDLLENNPNKVGAFHNCEIRYESELKSNLMIRSDENRRKFKLEDLTSSNFVHLSTFVFRSKFLPNEIFTDKYSALTFGDWPLVMLIARNGDILYQPFIMGVYRKNFGSTWGMQPEHVNIEKIINGLKLLIKYNWFDQKINIRLNKTQKKLKRNTCFIFILLRKIKNKFKTILRTYFLNKRICIIRFVY